MKKDHGWERALVLLPRKSITGQWTWGPLMARRVLGQLQYREETDAECEQRIADDAW